MSADNLRVPALLATIFAWAILGLTLVSAISQAIWLISYSQFAESPIMLAVTGIAGLLTYLAWIPSIITVLIWLFIANNNLHRAGVSGLNYSPGWATFSFLVPFVNLWVPYAALRELANRSAGEPEELADAGNDTVFSWYGCYIGAFVVGMFLIYTALVTLMPGIWITTPFWATQGLAILHGLLVAGAAFFLIKVIKRVTENQMAGIGAVRTFE